MRDEPKTILAVRIKRSQKRFLKELWQAFVLVVVMGAILGGCWVLDKYIVDKPRKERVK